MLPSKQLVYVLLAWFVGAILVSIWPGYTGVWKSASVVLWIIICIDLLYVLTTPRLEIERQVLPALSLGTWTPVQLVIHNHSNMRLHIRIYDHYPEHCEQQHLPLAVTLQKRNWAQLEYQIQPTRRGPCQFTAVQYRIRSMLGFWLRNRLQPNVTDVRVYPNFASIMKYSLLATENRAAQMGVLKKRRRGEGLEFHQLREYREGDPFRQIDWKATARLRKLISRDYQEERDQQILFLVDCGRRMLSHDETLSHFDHTLNAILLLSHIALQQGDAVGLLTFSGEQRWIAPRKSLQSVNLILNNIYDLQPCLVTPDYESAAINFMKRQTKRALVILLTNVRDEDADELLPAIRLLQKRHLVLLASMREKSIDNILHSEIHNYDDAIKYAATNQYLASRTKMHGKIEQSGALFMDVNPDQLAINIVNRYLEIKTSGRL